MQTTFGLGTGMGGGPRMGAGLTSMGQDQQRLGTQMLGEAAGLETQRNIGNQQRQAQAAQGGAQMGAMAGAKIGASFGPWGMLAGGLIGALGGSKLF